MERIPLDVLMFVTEVGNWWYLWGADSLVRMFHGTSVNLSFP